ncbi:MAG: DPP IV N-terminal domain-containing protein, partial [Chthoniobacterales bacterium]
MNFLTCSLVAAGVLYSLGANAQQTPPLSEPPDLSAKALITKEKPLAPRDSTAQPKENGKVKQYTIEQFMDTTKIGGSAFTHDEKAILFSSNKSSIYNVYSVNVDGGAPTQLTHSVKESTFIVTAFPEDARFLYTYDKGGNENSHLYLYELDGKERDLTPGEKTKANFFKWSTDRKSFFFGTNARNPKFFDVYEMKIADLKPSLIYQDDTGYDFADMSADRRFIAFGKSGDSTADSDTYLYNVATKEMKNLTGHQGEVQNAPQAFDPAAKYLYVLSNAGDEFMNLVRFDLTSGSRELVEKSKWDMTDMSFSRTGKYRVTTTNEDARSKVRIVETATGKPVELPALPDGDVTGVKVSDSQTKMAFSPNSPRSPNNLYVYDFAAKKVAKLSDTLSP